MNLSSVISLIGTAIGFLAILIAVFKQKGSFFKKNSFLLMLFCLTYYCLVVFLVDSGGILDYPHFFKTGSPFFYLLAISILWVGQSHLYQKRHFNKWDFALILIPILNIIEFIPFYLNTASEKREYLLDLIADRDQIIYAFEGWIPTFYHYLFSLLIGLGVSFFLLIQSIQQKKAGTVHQQVTSWLGILAAIFFVFYLTGLALLLFDSDDIPIHQLASWLFGLMLLFQLFFLFFKPEVLYGITPFQKSPKLPAVMPLVLEEEEAGEYRKNIEMYFTNNHHFLKQDFRQQHLADYMGITKNRLSQLIFLLYNQHFNQLLNEKRIKVSIDKLHNGEWINFTIEAIAQEVGFKSRTTFNKAFEEITGLTPSQFRKRLEKK